MEYIFTLAFWSKMIREQKMDKYQNFYRSNDKAILNSNGWNSCSMRSG